MFIDTRTNKKVVIVKVLDDNTVLVKPIGNNKKRYIVEKEFLKKIS